MAVWLCGCVHVGLCVGCEVVGLCGCGVVGLIGRVAVWPCGRMVVRPCGRVAVSAGSRGKGRGELPPSRIRRDQPEARSADLLRHPRRSPRCCSLCRPRYPRRCQTGSFGAGAGACSPAFWVARPVQMHTSAWAMIGWTCEGTLAAMSTQCLSFSCAQVEGAPCIQEVTRDHKAC